MERKKYICNTNLWAPRPWVSQVLVKTDYASLMKI